MRSQVCTLAPRSFPFATANCSFTHENGPLWYFNQGPLRFIQRSFVTAFALNFKWKIERDGRLWSPRNASRLFATFQRRALEITRWIRFHLRACHNLTINRKAREEFSIDFDLSCHTHSFFFYWSYVYTAKLQGTDGLYSSRTSAICRSKNGKTTSFENCARNPNRGKNSGIITRLWFITSYHMLRSSFCEIAKSKTDCSVRKLQIVFRLFTMFEERVDHYFVWELCNKRVLDLYIVQSEVIEPGVDWKRQLE